MPRALDRPVRQRIANLLPLGLSTAVIARLAGASVWSVRRLRARLAQGDRPDPLQPDYRRSGRRRPEPPQALRLLCGQLRRQHRTWGAGRIRLELRATAGGAPLPTERTLQRWLKEQGLVPQPAVLDRPAPPRAWAEEPHDTWQMDAKERVRLADGTLVGWLRLVDEASGAVLLTAVLPVATWADAEAEQVRQALRAAFARWGKPRCLRVDNGYPWGATGGLPTLLALWLAGLGVALATNPPRQPKANARVERSQRTAAAWAEPGSCADAHALEQRLEQEDRLQRQEYPAIDGRSRRAALPVLAALRSRLCGPWGSRLLGLGSGAGVAGAVGGAAPGRSQGAGVAVRPALPGGDGLRRADGAGAVGRAGRGVGGAQRGGRGVAPLSGAGAERGGDPPRPGGPAAPAAGRATFRSGPSEQPFCRVTSPSPGRRGGVVSS
jgi:hypothetical protein